MPARIFTLLVQAENKDWVEFELELLKRKLGTKPHTHKNLRHVLALEGSFEKKQIAEVLRYEAGYTVQVLEEQGIPFPIPPAPVPAKKPA